jgi:hypothetical protein
MADVETPAAESSPAAPAAAPEPQAEPVSVPTDPEAYAEWRQTGKLPDKDAKPSKREDSATSKNKSVDSEESESAAVPETASPAGRRNAQKRIDQLTFEKESFRRELEELKAKTGKQDAKTPESSSVPAAAETAPDALKRPVKPKQEDFDTWSEYEKAQDKYLEDLADYKAAQRIEEHTQRQRQEAVTQEMQRRLDQASERYGKEAEATIVGTAKGIFDDQKVAPAIKAAIGRSDVIVDALYVMGSDAEELADFLNLSKNDPIEALRKWFTVEALVKQELQSGSAKGAAESGVPERGPDGKFLPVKSAEKPAKRIEAPSPPRELNGNAAPPGDERERAAKIGDFRSFKADADRRDMARFKGQ